MRIVVLDGHALNPGDLSWDAIAAFGEFAVHDRTPEEAILSRAAGAQILITNKTPLRADTQAALPDLRCICVLATGYDVVDTVAAKTRNIPVCNTPAYGVDSVAQHVFALLFALCRNTALHEASVRAGRWGECADFCYWLTPQTELTGKVMGIAGFGNIGRRVGELARAFGMEVLTYSPRAGGPSASPPVAHVPFVEIDELFARSDVLSLHCPLTESTRGMVNKERLGRMKKGSLLINTARGSLLDEAAVAEALHSGRLGGLGTDVLSVEPPSAGNPLLGTPNTFITPHIAWAGLNARQTIMRMTAENIQAFIDGKPRNVVNP